MFWCKNTTKQSKQYRMYYSFFLSLTMYLDVSTIFGVCCTLCFIWLLVWVSGGLGLVLTLVRPPLSLPPPFLHPTKTKSFIVYIVVRQFFFFEAKALLLVIVSPCWLLPVNNGVFWKWEGGKTVCRQILQIFEP